MQRRDHTSKVAWRVFKHEVFMNWRNFTLMLNVYKGTNSSNKCKGFNHGKLTQGVQK